MRTNSRLVLRLILLALLVLVLPLAARAEQASIDILAPKDGEVLDPGETYALAYEIVPGPGGDHFHVWVDGERGPGVHTTKGRYDLPKLAPGEHTITIKIVDKGHVPTGPEKTIKVRVRQG